MVVAARRAVLVGLLVVASCHAPDDDAPLSFDDGPRTLDDDAGASTGELTPPLGERITAVGSDGTLDIATWNLEHFPKDDDTVALVAEIVRALALDVVALQEVTSDAAFDALREALPEFDGVVSSHVYASGDAQKLALLARREVVTLSDVGLVFTSDPEAFPRPCLKARAVVETIAGPRDLTLVVVHLKAGTDDDDRARRTLAMQDLEALVRQELDGVGDDEVVVLGDMNEVLTHEAALAVWAPFLDAPERYDVVTRELAVFGAASFIPAGVMLDHVIVTRALDGARGGRPAFVARIDDVLPSYLGEVSDHRPVGISLALE